MQAAAGRLRVSGAKSALRASEGGRLRVGSWPLRLPQSFHAWRHSGSMCRTLSAAEQTDSAPCVEQICRRSGALRASYTKLVVWVQCLPPSLET